MSATARCKQQASPLWNAIFSIYADWGRIHSLTACFIVGFEGYERDKEMRWWGTQADCSASFGAMAGWLFADWCCFDAALMIDAAFDAGWLDFFNYGIYHFHVFSFYQLKQTKRKFTDMAISVDVNVLYCAIWRWSCVPSLSIFSAIYRRHLRKFAGDVAGVVAGNLCGYCILATLSATLF